MKGLVRGGILASTLSLLAIFIYAQTTTIKDDLVIADGTSSQAVAQTIVEDNLIDTFNTQTIDEDVVVVDDEKDKKLVKTTASVAAAGMGASKGGFSATAYCFTGRTAMGHPVRRGLIAADPRVLPMGSKVYVKAGAWSGVYLVSDKGGGIKGKKIDIWVPGCAEARRFGRRSVEVFGVAK